MGGINMATYDKKSISTIVRKNVKKYRLIENITMQELADRCGLTHGYIRDLESLKIDKTPSLDTIAKLCNALSIEPQDLFRK